MLKPLFGLILAIAVSAPGIAVAQSSNGLALSSDQPVQVDGDRLEIFEDLGRAVFDGNVTVVQGDTVLKTSKLTIFYSGNGNGSIAAGAADIERLEATGGVNIQTATQVATGENGTYDMAREVLVLTGDPVVLTENGNVAKGCKLTVTQSTGRARLEGCSQATRPAIVIRPNSGN